MPEEMVQTGQLVRSAAGRDKGRFYLIYDVLDEAFVRVIDGDKKGLSNPKRKNRKHLEFLPQKAENVAKSLQRGESVRDEEVLAAVKTLGLSHKDFHIEQKGG
ncbi:MAG: RNA-binding protein [Firmicutes bacterium HGW-Firmicutes-14]|nr:MAG: RNA-binding protein [Firmicutes bacterium HGW-Firmicutes-14]